MSSAGNYPWYQLIRDESLEQGDILQGFRIPLFTEEAVGRDDPEIDIYTIDVIIMTQSCDLSHGKVRTAVLCPVTSLRKFADDAADRGDPQWKKENNRKKLKQGVVVAHHLINEYTDEQLTFPVSVVSFAEVYSASLISIRQFVADRRPRLRLCPPYKEHLAQAFARFFMRVGLPVDIADEKLRP